MHKILKNSRKKCDKILINNRICNQLDVEIFFNFFCDWKPKK